MKLDKFKKTLIGLGYQLEFHAHAEAILSSDFPEAISELGGVLSKFKINIENLVRGGGGEALPTQELRHALADVGWKKHNFEIKKLIDGREAESKSHEIDHVRALKSGKIGLEIEWNNKDPFYDRDLENFKRLHAEGAISVGAIITRGASLQDQIRDLILKFAQSRNVTSFVDLEAYDLAPTGRQKKMVSDRMNRSSTTFAEAWSHIFCSDKYGQATTHWRKLEDRVHRGVGNPCPLLLIGLPASIVVG